MRLIEASVGGVVVAAVVVALVAYAGIDELFVPGMVAFAATFLAVLLRSDRSINVGRR